MKFNKSILTKEEVKNLMLIADKYNFRELFKTCDSYLAQWYAYMLDLCCFAAKPSATSGPASRLTKNKES